MEMNINIVSREYFLYEEHACFVLVIHYDLYVMQSLGMNAPGGLHLVYEGLLW
jgi:hypothetical protein